MMLLFYFGKWDVGHGFINGDFAYMLVFLAVAAFAAGRILGLDQYIENYDVGGETLVERYPGPLEGLTTCEMRWESVEPK